MTLRQALVAVRDSHEGPWQRSQGAEIGIRVRGLGMGESIVCEHDGGSPTTYERDGDYPFPRSTRFRFLKQASLFEPGETFVQVILK